MKRRKCNQPHVKEAAPKRITAIPSCNGILHISQELDLIFTDFSHADRGIDGKEKEICKNVI